MNSRKIIALIFFCFSTTLFLLTPHISAKTNEIRIIRLDDATINPITAQYIVDSIENAEQDGAQCIIIELDTPGGLLTSTRTIVKKILSANVPVIVYIYPSGSRAGSAGVFITYASHVAAMAPSTNIGAAHPVQLGNKNRQSDIVDILRKAFGKKPSDEFEKKEKPADDQDPMSSKILNDTVAFIKAIAEKRNRNVEWAQLSVKESVSITEKEAFAKNVIEIIAQDEEDLIEQLNGKKLNVNGQSIILKTDNAQIRHTAMNIRQKLLNVLANPNIAYIFMILGFYGLLYEVTHPGIGVPGVVGAIFLILAFFSMQALPTNYAGLALIALGIILLIAEAMAPGFGLLALGGLVCLVLGSTILFDSPDPFMRVSLSIVIPLSVATTGLTIFLVQLVVRAHKKKAMSGKEGLLGEAGCARTDIKPQNEGKVFVHGEIWNAISDESIKRDEKIIVTKINGMVLTVTKQKGKE